MFIATAADMSKTRLVAVGALAGYFLALVACSGNETAPNNDAGTSGGGGSGGGGNGGAGTVEGGILTWYATCGDPVCRVPDDASTHDSGVAQCTDAQALGERCENAGATCGDPDRNCGSVLLCADHDPKGGGSCPISSRRFKDDIQYVSSTQIDALAEELYTIRLATYRYKQGDSARHLGFILEDSPTIPASDLGHARVDLYAYTSMAVAALQAQNRIIQQLQADVDSLTNQVDAISGKQPPVSSRSIPHQ
jgi:hypothetical protein